MKKMKRVLLLISAVVFCYGCSENTIIDAGVSQAISFETHVIKSSKSVPVTSFQDGDVVGVLAYQSVANWSANGANGTPYIDNLPLKHSSSSWGLDIVRYWDKGCNYTFFGYAPYSSSSLIKDGVLKSYIVASDVKSQHDFMLSIPSDDTRDMIYDGVENPPTVKFAFAHAMSQVRFSASTNNDYSRLYTIEMKSIAIRGISNKGDIDLAASTLTTNPWTNQSASPVDYAASVTLATPIPFGDALTSITGSDVFMLMPQVFTDAAIEFTVRVTNKNAGGPTPTGDYPVTAKISGRWDRNKVYHYEATLDMEQILGVKPIVIGDPSIIDWEAEPGSEIFFGVNVTVPDAEPESTEADIKVSKPYAPVSLPMQIDNSGSGDEWRAAVSSIAKSPVDWLTLADDAEGGNPETIKIGKGNSTVYINIRENETGEDRVAYVKITRKNAMDVVITVKQAKENTAFNVTAPDADKESTETDIKLTKDYRVFASALQVKNAGSDREWNATVTKGDDWLSLADDATGKNPAATKTGTKDSTLYMRALESSLTADRTATIVVKRTNATSVTITVTQTKENRAFIVTVPEATGSTTVKMLAKAYNTFASPLQIDNAGSDREWDATVTSGSDWLKLADNTSGGGQATTKTGTANKNIYMYATENPQAADRTATIVVKRTNAASVTITVKQAQEITTFKVTLSEADAGGSSTAMKLSKYYPLFASPMEIDNTGNDRTWTATVSSGGDWLKLADNPSGGGQATTKTGTAGKKLYLYAADNNLTTTPRTTTVTVSRIKAQSVVITVRQLSDEIYVASTGLFWATGNLVARDGNNCKIGVPSDGGLYFQFGSTIGWKGGNSASGGTGEGIPNFANNTYWGGSATYTWENDKMVIPAAYRVLPPMWPVGLDATTLITYYFGVKTDPYDKRGQKLSSYSGWETGALIGAMTAVSDPCRQYLEGNWRTPTAEDYGKLFNSSKYNGALGGTEASWGVGENMGAGSSTKTFFAMSGPSPQYGKGIYANTTTTTVTDAVNDPTALFFSASGVRNNEGQITFVGSMGLYSSASINGADHTLSMGFDGAKIYPHQSAVRYIASAMRCVHP